MRTGRVLLSLGSGCRHRNVEGRGRGGKRGGGNVRKTEREAGARNGNCFGGGGHVKDTTYVVEFCAWRA